MKSLIYFDNNASTRIDPLVLDAMMPFLTEQYANSASTHHFGTSVNEAVKVARGQIADLIGSTIDEIIFTSGATEAINLAIKGVAESYKDIGKHIITVKTEHSAVLDTCKFLETQGFDVSYLNVGKTGRIDLDDLRRAIRPDTILVCVMYANNETGVIQQVKEISEITHKSKALFMTDATQAVGKIAIDVEALQIDLMPFSGHKLYGPKGIGVLYVRQKRPRKLKLQTLQHGGGHEKGMRSGTLNVPGIVGLGKACEIASKQLKGDAKRILHLKNMLQEALLKFEGSFINGDSSTSLYNTLNVCFPGIDSDALIMGLSNADGQEAASTVLSNGSACTAMSVEPSHVLLAMGLTEELAFSSVRISLGRFNTEEEVNVALNQFDREIAKLRQYNKA